MLIECGTTNSKHVLPKFAFSHMHGSSSTCTVGHAATSRYCATAEALSLGCFFAYPCCCCWYASCRHEKEKCMSLVVLWLSVPIHAGAVFDFSALEFVAGASAACWSRHYCCSCLRFCGPPADVLPALFAPSAAATALPGVTSSSHHCLLL